MTHGFGIVGCGMISTFHARAIGDVPDAKLAACFDTRAEAAEKFAVQNNCKAYTKLEAMLVSLPLLILTLGLFYFVLNALLLWIASAIIPGYAIAGFVPALIGSLVVTVVNWLLGALTGKK